MVRAAIQPIDIGKKERSGNYFYNWFEELAKEPDWRTTIYGNRYPDHIIQYIDAFWNADDASKNITVEGTSSRSRVMRYKPSYGTTSKYAADYSSLRQLLSDAWKIPVGGAAGGTLAWLLSLGIPPAQLEQQLQNGATPQQIITQVMPDNAPLLEQNISTQIPAVDPNNGDFAENKANPANPPVETLDNSPETAKIPQIDEGNLDGLDPMFAQQIKEVLFKLAQKGWQPRVAEGLRSLEQQQEKINQGHSSIKDPKNSKHVQGVAVDIIDSRYGWGGPASDLNFQFWLDLGEAAREAGLTWGGDWKTLKDVAHVEIGKNTTGASIGVYRHAYQEIDWIKAKHMVRQLASLPWNPTQGSSSIVQELMQAGVPKQWLGRLYQEVYIVERSHAFAHRPWSHTYAMC